MPSQPPPPPLLTLPREIRNIILNFAHSDLTIPYLWRTYADPDLPFDVAPITIPSAPVRAVFLTHPLLRAEYRQVTEHWSLAAICDLDISVLGFRQIQEYEEEEVVRRPGVLGLLKEISVLLRFSGVGAVDEEGRTDIPWGHVDPFLHALASLAGKLEVVRMVYYQYQRRPIPHRECGVAEFERGFDFDFDAVGLGVGRGFGPKPSSLELELEGAGLGGTENGGDDGESEGGDGKGKKGSSMILNLRREGDGIKIGYHHIARGRGGGVARDRIFHRVTRISICLYTIPSYPLLYPATRSLSAAEREARILSQGNGEVDEEMLPHEVVNASRMAREYLEHVLEMLGEDEREVMRGWTGRMQGFVEFEREGY